MKKRLCHFQKKKEFCHFLQGKKACDKKQARGVQNGKSSYPAGVLLSEKGEGSNGFKNADWHLDSRVTA